MNNVRDIFYFVSGYSDLWIIRPGFLEFPPKTVQEYALIINKKYIPCHKETRAITFDKMIDKTMEMISGCKRE